MLLSMLCHGSYYTIAKHLAISLKIHENCLHFAIVKATLLAALISARLTDGQLFMTHTATS